MNAAGIIEKLKLVPLAGEGGYFRRTYAASEKMGARPCSTAIYYLVTPESFSSLHRLQQDEMFHFYLGDPVEMLQITSEGVRSLRTLGSDLSAGQEPQVLAPGKVWQGTRLVGDGKWALLGCTVSPGFEYADNEIPERAKLLELFPQHAEWITKFTHA